MRKLFSFFGSVMVLGIVVGATVITLAAPPAYADPAPAALAAPAAAPEPPEVDDSNVVPAPAPAGPQAPSATMPKIPRIDSLPGVDLSDVTKGDSVFDYLIDRFIPRVIRGFMVFVAVSALLFTVISGVKFVLAMGNTEKAADARKSLTYALVGLVIALLSFVVVSIINRLGSVLDVRPQSFVIEEVFAADPVAVPPALPSPSPIDGRVRELFPSQSELFGERGPRLIGGSDEDLLKDLAPRIVKVILALGGAVVFIILIITGIRLVSAQGGEEELEESKRTFLYLAIGLAVIVLAYAFVFGLVRIFSNF